MTDSQRELLQKNAKKYAKRPYVWGGESMKEGGYDCSGYIYNVLKDSGFSVTRTTANGYRALGKKIPVGQQQPGDLLFFGTAAKATHIAMYDGNNHMWESIGGSKNTRNNPGKGVTLSPVSRRKDLFEVRTLSEAETTLEVSGKEDTPRNWLQKGDRGQQVADMQTMLIAAGYSCGTSGIDGIFGTATQNALLSFQKEHGLAADGLFGTKSKSELERRILSQKPISSRNYVIGQTYTLQAEMKVRTGPGIRYRPRTHGELTRDGQKHDADKDGALDKGTRVTCREIKKAGNDTWMLTPSGWIAAIYDHKVYIR